MLVGLTKLPFYCVRCLRVTLFQPGTLALADINPEAAFRPGGTTYGTGTNLSWTLSALQRIIDYARTGQAMLENVSE